MSRPKPARRSFGPAPLPIDTPIIDLSTRVRVCPPLVLEDQTFSDRLQTSPTLSPESREYMTEKIPIGGTRSRPSKVQPPNHNPTDNPRASTQINEQRSDSTDLSPSRQYDRKCLEHLKAITLGSRRYVDIATSDWEDGLPFEVGDRLILCMYENEAYDLTIDGDDLRVLVHEVYGKSNMSWRLKDDYISLAIMVAKRVTCLQSMLLSQGFLEDLSGGNYSGKCCMSRRFRPYWNEYKERRDLDKQTMADDPTYVDLGDVDTDSDEEFPLVEDIWSKSPERKGNSLKVGKTKVCTAEIPFFKVILID